ncbi:Eco57I restriction-modification methylase domain-containing protein [Robiginitalea biformata]|uniref:site-specific DNA-methyltransferase (adenine-specific) n=1 Tax=Robiginitalea biformata (strain ATCC BAA-864 / DSM 15991 / KCTC 12146 / HTCC2501) TaxID=313596 RepID=A4CM25_ROBBH|nr:TaqI-like C-terminal specificity domain-containing protein [Robiginitalea biformata]EAR14717.1 type II restriction enzyme, methylase subunit [Robiginitalea biformata HTCC2501]
MPIYQNSVLKKYLKTLDADTIGNAYERYTRHFHNASIQENIRNAKEEQYQGEFLIDLFVNILGYTKNPHPDFNLTTELKNVKDAKKADGAILKGETALAVIELKGTDTTDLGKVEAQAFGYKNNQPGCKYVITSNFEKLRFYIDNAVDFEEFHLFQLPRERFEILWLCLSSECLLKDLPKKIKEESLTQEEKITKTLYKDYSAFRTAVFQNISEANPQYDKLLLFKKTQKLLDRFLFIFFAEDRLLLPPNSIRTILQQWTDLKDKYDEYFPLYERFQKYFGYLNSGYKGKKHDIFAYNGGLFEEDEILDSITIDDNLLYEHTRNLSNYDFESEVSVNILGHIFEHSLTEIENIQAEIEGAEIDKSKTKRKKDGVFYTPKYITKYIVENTVGKLCEEKKAELDITDEAYQPAKQRSRKRLQKLQDYRDWLLQLTICDPACGSGAFLNQALEFLIAEHRYIDELSAKYNKDALILSDVENTILENNLFGVDINEESVEIAKLSLWLRTAQKGRKLTSLSDNIKCGNSLIDDPKVAGDKAFNWQEEFPEVFEKGGFDVVIGNPPYGAKLNTSAINYFREVYKTVIGHSEAYYLFIDITINKLLQPDALLGFIIPNAWLSNKYAKELRRLVLFETRMLSLINFNRQIIFEDASVETSIVITKKVNPKPDDRVRVGQNTNELYPYLQLEWSRNSNYLLSFSPDLRIHEIVSKLNSSEKKLVECLDISNGFKPYQAGYGQNLQGKPLTSEDVKGRIYHSEIPLDDSYVKEIKGKGVHRYSLNWTPSYVKWGKWLMSPKSEHYYKQHKILLRQITGEYFFAVLDMEQYFADQSLYVCTYYNSKPKTNLWFYLALLNSRLYGFYFRKYYSEEDDLFPKIKVNELKELPVKHCSNLLQISLGSKAKLMQEQNEKMDLINQSFCRHLQEKFNFEKLSKRLKNWSKQNFAEFLKELKKQKIKLTLSEEGEWLFYFNEQKDKVQVLQNQIDQTDREIDQMVYELYGLTKEEIQIVENS